MSRKPAKKTAALHLGAERGYRRSLDPAAGEVSFQVVVEQTDLHVVARRDLSSAMGSFLHGLRGPLKAYIAAHPEYLESLAPVEVGPDASPLVRDMAEAARACGVGPMAAVAGAIAQAVADRFAPESPDLLVENGGDCYLHSTKPRTVALLADPAGGPSLGLLLNPRDFPCSLCSSSASIGHSLSLGAGDLIAVRAASGALADAAATALGNLLRTRRDLSRVTAAAQALQPAGIDGVFAQLGGSIAVWGEMELVALG